MTLCHIKSCKRKGISWIRRKRFCQKHFLRYRELRKYFKNSSSEEIFKYFLKHPEHDFWSVKKTFLKYKRTNEIKGLKWQKKTSQNKDQQKNQR